MSDRTQRVIAAVNAASREPFAWGALDCCQFGDSVARAVTGVSFVQAFHYSTAREAVVLLHAHGGLQSIITRTLGVEPSGVLQLQDGDPVLAELPDGATVGVKLGERVVFKTEAGVGWLPVLAPEVMCGWSLEGAAACRKQ